MANKNVIVLVPNGRRQNVKVTPNTTIIQILEEVCNKHGLKPEEYDIKHHNHILDVSSIMRFSGLPNNAKLEMCAIQRVRAETEVILGLQLESGDRLTANFFPSDNLWKILMDMCPNEIKENPVVIYMRQEIYGPDALKSTTLKSLGLTGGRAMIRLMHRNPENLHKQANVSAPLPAKPTKEVSEDRKCQMKKLNKENTKMENVKNTETPSVPPAQKKDNKLFVNEFLRKEKYKKTDNPSKIKTTKPSSKNIQEVTNERGEQRFNEPIPNVEMQKDALADLVFLGERNALAFSLDVAPTIPHELPDEFFELTIQDAKQLLHDLKQKRIELEEQPLQTAATRNLEHNKKILRQIHQYKKTIIRIQFPDRTVLQGTFKPLERVEHVKNFVKEYLENSQLNFHLYTTPPKQILSPDITLVDAGCVPSALIHFGVDGMKQENVNFLRSDLFGQFTSHSIASLAAAKSRQEDRSFFDVINANDHNFLISLDFDVNVGASTSSGPA